MAPQVLRADFRECDVAVKRVLPAKDPLDAEKNQLFNAKGAKGSVSLTPSVLKVSDPLSE